MLPGGHGHGEELFRYAAVMDTVLRNTIATIAAHGWAVQIVSDHGCGNDHDHDRPLFRSGRDPYLYTVGLTAAGLPELLLQLPDRNTVGWIQTGQRMLNGLAAHTLHEELTVGQHLPIRGGLTVTVAEPAPFSRDTGRLWPGMAYRLYGQAKVRVLEVVPSW